MTKYLFALCLTLLSVNTLFAQRLEIGGGIGLTNYKGDYAPVFSPKNTSYGLQGMVRYNLKSHFSVRGALLVANISGKMLNNPSDPYLKSLNYNFQSRIIQLDAIAEYNFFDFRSKKRQEVYSIYAFGGISVANYATNRRTLVYRNTQQFFNPVIPIGVGVKLASTKKINLGVELYSAHSLSDALDGYKDDKNYRHASIKNDSYLFLNVWVTYRLMKIACPRNHVFDVSNDF